MNGTVVARGRVERVSGVGGGPGRGLGGAWCVWWGGVAWEGGDGLFMMPSPINRAEVMTQIVLPLHGVTPVDSRPLLPDTLGIGRGEHSVL